MTLLSFASMNLLLQVGLILVATLLLLFSKLSSTTFKALGFSLFLISTMLIIQGLFYSRNQTVLFSVLGVSFYKEGSDLRHHSGLSSIGDYFDQWLFMVTTSISENAAYLEQSGLSYKTVYVLMSVCYILPEMMRNMRKIQQAHKSSRNQSAKTLIQKLKSVLPVLIPLVIKTLDQSMARSISLQLRGFDNPQPDCQNLPARVSPVADAAHWSDWIGNFIDWVEDMDEDKRIVIENLTTRYPGTEQPQLRQINAEVHTGQVVGIIGNSHPANRHCAVCWQGSFPKWCLLRLRATGT